MTEAEAWLARFGFEDGEQWFSDLLATREHLCKLLADEQGVVRILPLEIVWSQGDEEGEVGVVSGYKFPDGSGVVLIGEIWDVVDTDHDTELGTVIW
jgi:hypothetical protein